MMKKITFAILLSLLTVGARAEYVCGKWNVIPLPQSVMLTDAKPFVISAATSVMVSGDSRNDKMNRNAAFLRKSVSEMTGISMRMADVGRKNQIVLGLDKAIHNAEGYNIIADHNRITINGKTEAAVFYGIQTLRKALPVVTNAKRIALPACSINDYPRFPYRGFLVDVGRHFFPVSYIKEIIDMLALHNINYFHWHLTDDQGWRIEIKKYPRLTETGSFRKETVTAYGSKSYDGVPVKGFYTQDEAREIIEYAAERYITVIPEIDMPGHMMAALASYPELGCTGGPYEVPCDFGVFKDVLCCGKAHTLQFAYDVLNEIMDVFPSKYIHIGGDECPKERWKECQSCQQKIKDLNLIDEAGHTKEDQLQTWFMGRMEELIKSRGRKMMGWDEILDGLPSKTITVMAWTSYDASVRSAKEGHATIVSPYNNFYFSNPHWNKLTGIKSMERVYDLEPVSDKLTADEAADVIGAQGCIWTEWVKDSVKMEYEMMPRIAGLSEVQWTVKDKKNLTDFMQRLPHMIDIYKMEGWNYKDDILNPPATDEKTKE